MKKSLLMAMTASLWLSCLSAEEMFDPTIPVVDMNDFDQPETREKVVETVRAALHEHGFFATINTGIDESIINEAFAAAKDYFDQPEAEKMKEYAPWTDGQRGYIPFGSEKGKNLKAPDFKEFYHLGREWSEEQLQRLNCPKNIWPEKTEFELKMKQYIAHLEVYMKKLSSVIALAMGCDEDFYDTYTSEGESILRVVHYPPMEKNFVDKEAIWAGRHTDINLFTILPQATAEGLEVLLGDGTWMPVHAQKGSMIINAGDMTEAFSNGYFKSAVHRVKAPKDNLDSERFSMVFFVHAKKNDLIYPLPHCVEWTGGKKKYAHAKSIELKAERFTENRQASDEFIQYLADCGVMDRLIDVKRASYEAMSILRERGLASDKVLKALEDLETKSAGENGG